MIIWRKVLFDKWHNDIRLLKVKWLVLFGKQNFENSLNSKNSFSFNGYFYTFYSIVFFMHGAPKIPHVWHQITFFIILFLLSVLCKKKCWYVTSQEVEATCIFKSKTKQILPIITVQTPENQQN